MPLDRRTVFVAATGILAGVSFFSLDLVIDLAFPEAVVAHALMESIEFLIIGPGVGLACALLVLRLQEVRRRAREAELARRLLWLGRLAATMAHEIRNPLHNARLAVEALREDRPDIVGHPLLADLDMGLARIDGAVGLIYRLARPPAGVQAALDPAPVVAEAAAMWPGLAGASLAGGRVRIDPALLRTAVDNLLRNAVEASAAAAVTVEASTRPDGWRLRIANPGRLPDGFQPSALEDACTGSPKSGGLGLGVAVANHIAQLAGGSLDLRQDGDRVVAVLTLPTVD
jgi:signal transduction histidine kinase